MDFNRPFWTLVVYTAIGIALLMALWVSDEIHGVVAIVLSVLMVGVSISVSRPVRTRLQHPREEMVDTSIAAAILDSLPDPVVLLNAKREVLALNQSAIDLMGEEARGRDLSLSFRYPDVLDGVNEAIAGSKFKGAEITTVTPVRRTFEVFATPFPKGTLTAMRAILVLHDVTSSKQAEAIRGDFVANVSHELRSPLSSLVGFIETLQGPAKDDEPAREKFLGVMEVEAGRMARLIDDLLSLAAIEANEHVRPLGKVDVPEILNHVVNALSLKAKKRGISFELDVDEDLEPLTGDTDELTEIFTNLAENALKYGAAGKPVNVRATRVLRIPNLGGRGIQVQVINQGDPIAAKHLARLTERFYRIDKGRSRKMGGTGLGLAIVKHIVAHHRGQLMVDSNDAIGTVFSVYLPSD